MTSRLPRQQNPFLMGEAFAKWILHADVAWNFLEDSLLWLCKGHRPASYHRENIQDTPQMTAVLSATLKGRLS